MIMKLFFHDMIHMTEGEKFINYWWLWLGIILIAFSTQYLINKKEG